MAPARSVLLGRSDQESGTALPRNIRILCDLGVAALRTVIGGLIAQSVGLTSPFWAAAAVMLLVAGCAWKPLGLARIE